MNDQRIKREDSFLSKILFQYQKGLGQPTASKTKKPRSSPQDSQKDSVPPPFSTTKSTSYSRALKQIREAGMHDRHEQRLEERQTGKRWLDFDTDSQPNSYASRMSPWAVKSQDCKREKLGIGRSNLSQARLEQSAKVYTPSLMRNKAVDSQEEL
nr:hypothetical protein Iba_chr02fCG1770 [Ipomoea batatas]